MNPPTPQEIAEPCRGCGSTVMPTAIFGEHHTLAVVRALYGCKSRRVWWSSYLDVEEPAR